MAVITSPARGLAILVLTCNYLSETTVYPFHSFLQFQIRLCRALATA